jgi:3-oxoadipate enol-lactonase
MPHAQCNGISLFYEARGHGEPLVLISGLGGDHAFWQSSVDALDSHFQLITFDTRGIGKSDAPDAPYSMEVFSDDLAGLLDSLKLERANVLGFSMGGNIAQMFALRYPRRISKLILAASFASMNIQARLFLDAVLRVYESGASTGQMFDLIAPWLFSPGFLARPENAAFLQYDESDPNAQPFYAWKRQYVAQQQFNVVDTLCEITAPTLILAGEEDRLAHLEDSKILARHIQNSTLHVFPGAGHLINYESPKLFHRCVRDFLLAE